SPMAAADFKAGQTAYEAGDYETALAQWQPLADAGDPRAQFGLGTMYASGFGVALDDAQAFHWLGLAAEQGNVQAQYQLGVMHQNGWGVPMSSEQAADWFVQAAEQGLTDAQVALGQIYAAEYDGLFDAAKSYQWLAIAAKLGDLNATNKRDDIARKLSAEQIEEADLAVTEWLTAHPSLRAE
ncbi:MAG: tetratricopeptide repeat protein, partial [Woeseia sp.]